MKIPVNEKYQISSDAHAYCIQQWRPNNKNPEKSRWLAERWYPTLAAAIQGLAELQLRLSDASNLVEAQAEWKRICEELETAVRGEAGAPWRPDPLDLGVHQGSDVSER